MNILDQYVIPLKGLSDGDHAYDFKISDKFFEKFENSEIKKGKLNAEVILSKHAAVISVTFNITGTVELICDRCLDNFDYPLKSSNKLYIKFGTEPTENLDDVIFLPDIKQQLFIAQYIYEFINLNISLKRTHPDDKDGNSLCNSEMLKKLNELNIDKTNNIDPRWEKLKNIK